VKGDPIYRKAIGIGGALGVLLGVAIHNFELGVVIGIALGAGFAAYAKRKGR